MANSYRNNRSGEIAYTVHAKVGTVTEYPTGWTKEINIITWNGGQPKFDIRDWDPDHEHMSRGITLHEEEARVVSMLIGGWLNGTGGREQIAPVSDKHAAAEREEHAAPMSEEQPMPMAEAQSAPVSEEHTVTMSEEQSADAVYTAGDDVLFDPETGEVMQD